MRLYENETKKIFEKEKIKVPRGTLVDSIEKAVLAANEIGYPVVIKIQILAGGRGKIGGVVFASNEKEVKSLAKNLLNKEIKGEIVRYLLIEEKIKIQKEIYISITMDRANKKPVIILSKQGGIDIEDLAKSKPESIIKYWIDTETGFYAYHGINLFKKAGFKGQLLKELSVVAEKLYKIFCDYESELVEINPLVINNNGDVLAADGKMIIDENGEGVKKLNKDNKNEQVRYVDLEGDIGILANGAGLTMMTMDVVLNEGGKPANFLEVGGELYKKSEEALYFLLAKKQLNGILVNLFGAYARTDIIIEGILKGMENKKIDCPIIFRVRGTGELRARRLLQDKLGVLPYTELEEAAKEIVELSKQYKDRRV